MNDVDRILYEKSRGGLDGRYNLMPELFQGGEERQAVANRLLSAGYDRFGTTRPTLELFYKYGGQSMLICAVTYGITVRFGDDSRLLTAHTDNRSACP